MRHADIVGHTAIIRVVGMGVADSRVASILGVVVILGIG